MGSGTLHTRLLFFWLVVRCACVVQVVGDRAGGRRRWVQDVARLRRAWLLATARLQRWKVDLASHSGSDGGLVQPAVSRWRRHSGASCRLDHWRVGSARRLGLVF